MAPFSVLITAASRRVPLVRAFQTGLAAAGVRGHVIVTDVNPLSPAVHVADRWFEVPLATSSGYLEAISTICEDEGVSLVVPTIDDELESFGAAADSFRARGVTVAVSPESTSRTCRDKLATCTFLRAKGIAAADSMMPDDVPAAPAFPLFIKPRYGRGGVGAFPAHSPRELQFFSSYVEHPVVQESLDGPEFTVDLLCDFEHRPIAIVPRERVVIRAGVIDRGRTVKDQRLVDLAEKTASVLPFAGAANIQCRIVDGRPVVFEINPRFSGGIPLTIAAGADFPRCLIELTLGRAVPPRIGDFQADLWMTNYESSIFVHARELENRRRTPVLVGGVA